MSVTGIEPKRFIITAIDYATRWPVAQAVKHHTGSDVRRFIGKEIVGRFGVPEFLITNGGPELVSSKMKAYLGTKGIQHTVTTPYHPQANGQVERLNGSLVKIISKLSKESPTS